MVADGSSNDSDAIRYDAALDDVNWPRLIHDLDADDFHNGRTPAELEASFGNSQIVVSAWSGDRLVGTARAP